MGFAETDCICVNWASDRATLNSSIFLTIDKFSTAGSLGLTHNS